MEILLVLFKSVFGFSAKSWRQLFGLALFCCSDMGQAVRIFLKQNRFGYICSVYPIGFGPFFRHGQARTGFSGIWEKRHDEYLEPSWLYQGVPRGGKDQRG